MLLFRDRSFSLKLLLILYPQTASQTGSAADENKEHPHLIFKNIRIYVMGQIFDWMIVNLLPYLLDLSLQSEE